jgi:hypothetical protein
MQTQLISYIPTKSSLMPEQITKVELVTLIQDAVFLYPKRLQMVPLKRCRWVTKNYGFI